MSLNQDQLAHFHRQLLSRRDQLNEEVRDGAERRLDEDAFINIASEAPDPGDASVATDRADLRNAEIGRDVGELREIEQAVARIKDQSYGECVDCGQDIPVERLQAYPTAMRCIRCQTAFEAQHATQSTPSI